MMNLALWLKGNGFRADQVQAFYPSPMATATAMYHTGLNPLVRLRRKGPARVPIPKGLKVRRLHKEGEKVDEKIAARGNAYADGNYPSPRRGRIVAERHLPRRVFVVEQVHAADVVGQRNRLLAAVRVALAAIDRDREVRDRRAVLGVAHLRVSTEIANQNNTTESTRHDALLLHAPATASAGRIDRATCREPHLLRLRLRRLRIANRAAALESIGITNFVVTACPTAYWSRQPELSVRPPSDDSAGFSFRQSLYSEDAAVYEAQFRAIETVRDRFGSVTVILQGEEVLLQRYDDVAWSYDDPRPEARAIESHPTVHHGVATVTGTLHASKDLVDLLRAAMPGGSVTGAPKLWAMRFIEKHEKSPRAWYGGAIGMVQAVRPRWWPVRRSRFCCRSTTW